MENNQSKVKAFKALGHDKRLTIIKILSRGEICVCEINRQMEISQANLSQHLKILKEANLVNSRSVGLEVRYCLNLEMITGLVDLLEYEIKDNKKEI